MNRYSTYYSSEIRLILLTKYNYKTLHGIDSLGRISLSLSVNDSKHMVSSLAALSKLSGPSGGVLSFKRPGSGNKYNAQQKNQVLLRSSIHGFSIFYFLENLVTYYLPRIRYFKGLPVSSINNKGNLSYTFKDLMIFPELEEELEL